MNVDSWVGLYVQKRDELEALEADHKERVAPIKAQMQKIEGALHKLMQDQNVQSIKTPHGTAFLQEWTSAKVEDYDALFWFAVNHNRPDLLPRSVNKTVVLEIGEDEVPGVIINRGIKTNVRRR